MQKHTKLNFPRLRKKLLHNFPFLIKEDDKSFKEACQLGFATLNACSNDNSNANDDDVQITLKEKQTEYQIIKNTVLNGSVKHQGRWTDSETRKLIYILRKGLFTNQIFNKDNRIN